ncbi:glycosyltransferase family 2 protein [Candidatus Wolfebacteria bacterium]|nr:glycosyltransferase family 2 protein [Candidatus Wolfebacteria bacterium]
MEKLFKKEKFILSICIPTYNEPDNVKLLLENLSKQSTPEVEILIRDDSTDDKTEKIVNSYLTKIPGQLRYFKGEKAAIGGYDIALLSLIESAKGDYIWWFGNDVMGDGAINKIITTIKRFPDISLIWINSAGIHNQSDVGVDFGGDRFFINADEVFETDVGLLGFSSIIKRKEAMEGMEESKKFIGSALACFYLSLHVLSGRKGRFYFIQKPYMLCTAKPSGEVRWYDSFQVHGINYFLISQKFKNKFNKKSFKKGLAKQFGQIWRAVLVERALGFTTGFGSKTPKIKKMFQCYWNFPEFWIALPFFLMPRIILRVFYRFYKIFFDRRHLRFSIFEKNYFLN